MKPFFFLILNMILAVALFSQVTNEERELLSPNIEMVQDALPALERELQAQEDEHRKNIQECERLQQQIPKESAFFKKNKMRLQLTWTQKKVKSLVTKIEESQVRFSIYGLVLSAFGRRTISSAELQRAVSLERRIEGRIKWADEQRQKAANRKEKTLRRLEEIPGEQKEVEAALADLEKRLSLLEYKKSWENLLSRTQINTQIAYNKAKLVKLKGEIVVLEKVKEDSIEQEKSMVLEKMEAEVALREMRRIK